MRRSAQRAASALLVTVLVAVVIAGGWHQLNAEMSRPSAVATPVRVDVPEGLPLRTVLLRLQPLGAIRHARLVTLYLRLHGQHPRIQAGRYELAPHATPREILEQFVSGRVLLASITIVEGWDFAQMRQALDADRDVGHQLRGLSDLQVMQTLGHADEPAEGHFFPDTYRFAVGTSDRKILEMAYERMQSALQVDWTQRAADLPLESPEQALTLASLIEKETGRPEERPLIAAVFVNRLRLGMRLQSDPTVIYGLGEHYDGSIHTRDLQTDTPYNTYTRAGLPPTPIALPGGAALQAALHPAPSTALYFVAVGDGSGTHTFSTTLAEHDVALRAYLRRLGATSTGASGSRGGLGAAQSPAIPAQP